MLKANGILIIPQGVYNPIQGVHFLGKYELMTTPGLWKNDILSHKSIKRIREEK